MCKIYFVNTSSYVDLLDRLRQPIMHWQTLIWTFTFHRMCRPFCRKGAKWPVENAKMQF